MKEGSISTAPETDQDPSDKQQHSIKIGDALFKKIDNHIRTIQRLGKAQRNKGEWIQDAIKEKLEKVKNLNVNSLPREKYLSVKLSKALSEELKRSVELLDRILNGYSKKKFILEAALEKLDREEDLLKNLLERQHRP